jgi:integration host factor subunit beta
MARDVLAGGSGEVITDKCGCVDVPDQPARMGGFVPRSGGLIGMSTTTKKDLIDRIADETGQKRTAVKVVVQSFLENVIRELSEGNRLEFRDFGVFEIRERAPRIAQNPKTLERVPVPAKKTVKFKVGRLMKLALEGEVDFDEDDSDDDDDGKPSKRKSEKDSEKEIEFSVE